jgi:hypothetical protein
MDHMDTDEYKRKLAAIPNGFHRAGYRYAFKHFKDQNVISRTLFLGAFPAEKGAIENGLSCKQYGTSCLFYKG